LLLFWRCWLKFHKDLKLLSLFISFTSKTISNFLSFMLNSYEKNQNTKILFFLLLFNFMQACLQRNELQKYL
jgi:hypothetical protein